MEHAQTPSTTEKFVASVILLGMLALVVFGIYAAFAYWLIPLRDANMRAFYQSCVERGGLITEGGLGPSCVGVRTPAE